MTVQWYPGHMTKTVRMIKENLSLVDVVIELLDARIPQSSKNPDIDMLAQNKFRILILNKADLADEQKTAVWKSWYENKGFKVLTADSQKGMGVSLITNAAKELMAEKIKQQQAKGRLFVPVMCMICGIPNVGKSTFINKYVGKAITQTGDKPGVTRGKQWIRLKKDIELLDTPGILWPKFDDREAGLKLAFTGAVNDDILDSVSLAEEFVTLLKNIAPSAIASRYKISIEESDKSHDILSKIGKARGFIVKGGQINTERAADMLLDEFRAGKLGRLTLEEPKQE